LADITCTAVVSTIDTSTSNPIANTTPNQNRRLLSSTFCTLRLAR